MKILVITSAVLAVSATTQAATAANWKQWNNGVTVSLNLDGGGPTFGDGRNWTGGYMMVPRKDLCQIRTTSNFTFTAMGGSFGSGLNPDQGAYSNAQYEVTLIPEPGAAALLELGGIALIMHNHPSSMNLLRCTRLTFSAS